MKPFLLASCAALLAGTLAFPRERVFPKPMAQLEAADLDVLRRAERLILVVADDFNGSSATVSLFTRSLGTGAWTLAGAPMPAVVGVEGLAWWRPSQAFRLRANPSRPSPISERLPGCFPLAPRFGFDEIRTSFDIPLVEGQHFCVDDTASPLYNRIVPEKAVDDDVSGERMWELPDYRRGLVINYPTDLKRHPASWYSSISGRRKEPGRQDVSASRSSMSKRCRNSAAKSMRRSPSFRERRSAGQRGSARARLRPNRAFPKSDAAQMTRLSRRQFGASLKGSLTTSGYWSRSEYAPRHRLAPMKTCLIAGTPPTSSGK